MRLRRPGLADWIVAALCGLWVASFVGMDTWGVPIGLASAALVLVLPQRPLLAGAGLAAVQWTLALAHVNDTPAGLVPFIVAVYSLGRHAPLWPAIGVSLTFAVSAALDPPALANLLFALALTAGVFAYGSVVQRRARLAEHSLAIASELQATDATALADRIVADERARLGGQALALLRDAVEGMRVDAAAAQVDLDVDRIDSVAARGRQAVTELRWLLGLLRSAPPPRRSEVATLQRGWVVDAVVAGILMALGLLEVALAESAGSSPVAWVLVVAVPLCTLVRVRYAAIACGVAALLIGTAALVGLPLILTSLVSVLLLAWSAGVVAGLVTWTAFVVLALVTIAWVTVNGTENLPMAMALLGLSAFAGHEWSAHDRARRAATTRAAHLRADLNARVDEARREERLRMARELHDVASHAVGVMVLQASAVQALREGDPVSARQALGAIDSTAEQALVELAALFDLLDLGAIGGPGLARAARDPLPAMVERLRSSGLEIALDMRDVPPELEDAVYRIVQESLTNVMRHSDAGHVQIRVTSYDGVLSVRVEDDGSPVERVGVPGSGFGLAGMAERVQALGGEFHAGRSDRGFTVAATMPTRPVVRR